MTSLHEADSTYSVWALKTQDLLWQKYATREVIFAGGISAMPSMHVAMATLFALVCWRTRRWLGIVMATYAVIIQIGSVHLAWHYAIDGYAGSLGMLLIWWAVGRALEFRKADRPVMVAPTPTQ
jgi:membrane-associated phospholipid phosphatase